MESIWIGVDGGGTHSTLAAVREDGTVLGFNKCPGLNFYLTDIATTRERLCNAVEDLLKKVGANDYRILSVGSAALDGRADTSQKLNFAGTMFPPQKLELCGDVFMAQYGASLGHAGVAVVSGTGAMVLGIDENGYEHFAGGWGYLLGDPGSAYGISVEAIRAVFAAEEGIGADTGLKTAALDYFNVKSIRSLIGRIYIEKSEPSVIAGFAQKVIALAISNDREALRILHEQYRILACQTAAVLEKSGGQVFLWGGMFKYNAFICDLFQNMLLDKYPSARLGEAALPPELGAVVWAMKKNGVLTGSILETMRSTWREKQ